MTEDRLQRPEGYSDEEWEAYKEGFTRAMGMVTRTAAAMSEMAAPDPAESGECPDCGAELVPALGSGGPVCPRCSVG